MNDRPIKTIKQIALELIRITSADADARIADATRLKLATIKRWRKQQENKK